MSEQVEVGAKKKTGFALLDPEVRRQISVRGGKASQLKDNPNRFTSETAKLAAEKSKNKGYRFTSETGRAAALKKQSNKENG